MAPDDPGPPSGSLRKGDPTEPKRRPPAGGALVAGKFYAGGQFLPAVGDIVSLDEASIAAELVNLTLGDKVYRRAMTAILGGSKAVRHRTVLRSRRLRAIARLVEAADQRGDRRTRQRLHEIHQRTLQGRLTLAGC